MKLVGNYHLKRALEIAKCEMVLEIVRPSWLEIVKEMDLKIKLDETCLSLLKVVLNKFGLYPNEIEKIIKVSNTIATLDNKTKIECSHLAEALQYISIRK